MKLKGLDGPVAGGSLEPVKIGTMIMSAPPQLCIRSGEEETAAAVTFYGSAPPELWTEVLPTDVQDTSHEQNSIQGTDSSDLDQLLHIDPSELQIGDKIAEGGQAEVYLAVWMPSSRPVVLKQFKRDAGVDLRQLQRRLKKVKEYEFRTAHPSFRICKILGVSIDEVDESGILSIVMERMAGDLRNVIDARTKPARDVKSMQFMPFFYPTAIRLMLSIASGMEDLHRCGLMHRDLKASNVLVELDGAAEKRAIEGLEESIWPSSFDDKSQELAFEVDFLELETKIGDYESSESVVGTGFWRAPEILEALKNNVKPRFSPKADVYSFGMVCYEILTGHHPFQGHPRSNYDLVLSGQRPELPPFVNEGMRSLLHLCWLPDPLQRLEWDQIKSRLQSERWKSRLPTLNGITYGHSRLGRLGQFEWEQITRLFGCFSRGATKVEVIEAAEETEAVAANVVCELL
jgi:serine/threonine protein kinase